MAQPVNYPYTDQSVSGGPGAFSLVTLTGNLYRSVVDSLTAHAGGGKGSALALTADFSRVTVVATAGDSVLLPPSQYGLEITLINDAVNPMQVYGAGTDTINGVATGTGVSQPGSSVVEYVCTAAGIWKAFGIGEGFSSQYPTSSAADSLTAIGANRAAALAITTVISRFSTVAASTGTVLPSSAAGLSFTIANAGANPLTVYATGSDTINGTAGATGVSLAAGKTATYFSASVGTWHALLSA